MSAWQADSCALQASAAGATGARHDGQAGSSRWVTEADFQAAQRMVSSAGLQEVTHHALHVSQHAEAVLHHWILCCSSWLPPIAWQAVCLLTSARCYLCHVLVRTGCCTSCVLAALRSSTLLDAQGINEHSGCYQIHL